MKKLFNCFSGKKIAAAVGLFTLAAAGFSANAEIPTFEWGETVTPSAENPVMELLPSGGELTSAKVVTNNGTYNLLVEMEGFLYTSEDLNYEDRISISSAETEDGNFVYYYENLDPETPYYLFYNPENNFDNVISFTFYRDDFEGNGDGDDDGEGEDDDNDFTNNYVDFGEPFTAGLVPDGDGDYSKNYGWLINTGDYSGPLTIKTNSKEDLFEIVDAFFFIGSDIFNDRTLAVTPSSGMETIQNEEGTYSYVYDVQPYTGENPWGYNYFIYWPQEDAVEFTVIEGGPDTQNGTQIYIDQATSIDADNLYYFVTEEAGTLKVETTVAFSNLIFTDESHQNPVNWATSTTSGEGDDTMYIYTAPVAAETTYYVWFSYPASIDYILLSMTEESGDDTPTEIGDATLQQIIEEESVVGVSLTWNDEAGKPYEISLTDNETEEIAIVAVDVDSALDAIVPEIEAINIVDNALVVTLDGALPLGKFELTIPAGYVNVGENGINAAQSISFTVTTTGIDSIFFNNTDIKVYNLNGVRVDKENLSKGIYIINGKKVVVRN